jgi:hypothetical protein
VAFADAASDFQIPLDTNSVFIYRARLHGSRCAFLTSPDRLGWSGSCPKSGRQPVVPRHSPGRGRRGEDHRANRGALRSQAGASCGRYRIRGGSDAELLVEEKGIAPHIPVNDKSQRDDGTLSRSDFQYDPTGDVYHCPGGKRLGTSGTVHEGKTLLYRASKLDCDVCPLKPQCCPKEPSRKIPRDIREHARDVARSFAGTEGFEQSRHERKKIEMRFAHLKRILKLGRLRLRGPRGAQDESVLAAIA